MLLHTHTHTHILFASATFFNLFLDMLIMRHRFRFDLSQLLKSSFFAGQEKHKNYVYIHITEHHTINSTEALTPLLVAEYGENVSIPTNFAHVVAAHTHLRCRRQSYRRHARAESSRLETLRNLLKVAALTCACCAFGIVAPLKHRPTNTQPLKIHITRKQMVSRYTTIIRNEV